VDSILVEKTLVDEKLLRISSEMDEFECYSGAHGRRIAQIADLLGSTFNLAARDRFFLQQAALIHDIGELSMHREYIRAAGGIAVSERIDLQRHPVIGEQETAKLGLPRGVQLIVRWHHEWWNGGGYPDGIEGEQIPVAARILRVADTYAAMTAARPFRAAISGADAKKYLAEWAGIEFDPSVVKTFLSITVPEETRTEPKTADPFAGNLSLV